MPRTPGGPQRLVYVVSAADKDRYTSAVPSALRLRCLRCFTRPKQRYRAHSLPVSENLLEQDFYASGPNQKWAGDITNLRTDEGWLYLAVVIDLWLRAVIG